MDAAGVDIPWCNPNPLARRRRRGLLLGQTTYDTRELNLTPEHHNVYVDAKSANIFGSVCRHWVALLYLLLHFSMFEVFLKFNCKNIKLTSVQFFVCSVSFSHYMPSYYQRLILINVWTLWLWLNHTGFHQRSRQKALFRALPQVYQEMTGDQ